MAAIQPAPSDCVSNEVKIPVNAPNLAIRKSASDSAFAVGVEAHFTLHVLNQGTAPTTEVSIVRDVVSSALQVLTDGLEEQGCAVEGQVVTCTIAPEFETNMQRDFVIKVMPLIEADQKSVTNTATVMGGGDPSCPVAEPCESNTVEVPVNAPSLSVRKAASADVFRVNVPGSYTLTVRNDGTTATTREAVVTDRIPSVLIISETPSGCVQGSDADASLITCTIPAGLAVGEESVFTVTVTPTEPGAGSSVINQAQVMGGGDPSCSTATSCVSNEVETPIDAPSLVLEKSANADYFVLGQESSYTLTVTNRGSAPTTSKITVTDSVPSALELVSIPTGCVQANGSNLLTCELESTLPANESHSWEIRVRPLPNSLGLALVNQAEMTGGGAPSCVTPCESNEVVRTVRSPQLQLSKAAPTTPLVVGSEATYTLRVMNAGDAPSTSDIIVTDSLPSSLDFRSADGCVASGHDVRCTITDELAPGAERSFAILVSVNSNAGSTVSNTASLQGGGDPLCEAAACSLEPVEVPSTRPLLTVSKDASEVRHVGERRYMARYQIEVANHGDAPGTYTLSDTPGFPPGTVLESWQISPSGGAMNPELPGQPTNGQSHQISTADTPIDANSVHTYTVAITFSANASDVQRICSEPASQGSGAYNEAAISGTGANTSPANACGDIVEQTPPTAVPVNSTLMLGLLAGLMLLLAGWRWLPRR